MTTQATTRRGSHSSHGSHGFSFVRIAIALQTLTIFLQAVSSGLLMTTAYGEVLHSVGARVTYGASMLYVLAAVAGLEAGRRARPGPCCTRPASWPWPRSRSRSASRTSRRSISRWAS